MSKSENKGIPFIWIIVGISVILLIVGLFAIAGSGKNLSKEEIIALTTNDTSYYTGNKDANVVLTEFSDFECPACASYSITLQKIKERNSDKVKIVYRHFPLRTIHKNADSGAEAAEAAGAQGKFWEMHDLLFENQSEWANLSGKDLQDKFVKYAQNIQVADLQKFESDISNNVYLSKIEKDVTDGNALGINATPTMFLNGVKLSNLSLDSIDAEIQKLLNSQ
jgi:protein-disulfide isomerase